MNLSLLLRNGLLKTRLTARLCMLSIVVLLAACNQSSQVVPTVIDLNVIATTDASTRAAETAVALNATATRDALSTQNAPPTLPPTWTPEPVATEPPVQPTQPLPTVSVGSGTIYYIFNGDSIALLNPADKHEELILVGGAPADLVLSPDEQSLAFTRQVSDNVREVFVMPLAAGDQQYTPRQLSCLGFARTLLPTWSADNLFITFAASENTNDPLGVYTADSKGQCPVGNHQRGLVQTQFKAMTGMVWSSDNKQIYFASGAVYAVDSVSGTLYPPVTQPTGYGPDSSPALRPNSTSLYYLKTERDEQTTLIGGVLAQVDTTQFGTFPLQELRSTLLLSDRFQFSRDGELLIATGSQDALVQNMDVGSAVVVVKNAKFPPQAIFSSDAETIAYVDAGAGPNLIQQIWVVNRRGTDRQQLTTHKEGTISNMNWAAG